MEKRLLHLQMSFVYFQMCSYHLHIKFILIFANVPPYACMQLCVGICLLTSEPGIRSCGAGVTSLCDLLNESAGV